MAIKLLIIDDHPTQIDGYKSILSFNELNKPLEITTCHNCKEAHKAITDPLNKDFFQLVFIDYSIPAYEEEKLYNGEDLAHLVRKYFHDPKIAIITSHTEAIVLYNVLKRVNPEGLLVKSDIDGEELLDAFHKLMQGERYYSETVSMAKKTMLSKEELLDTTNRKIIELLAQGIKTKNLPEHLHLSQSAIEKRKATIKDALGIDKGTDEDILKAVRLMGLL
ncbi:MAG: response regulator transcription factor [Flavobacteriales bacterium]|jgi:DNA-binding NarL/FixJ family response regulator|nr:response regulator transcription factor [Flavobacteriales bacterium]